MPITLRSQNKLLKRLDLQESVNFVVIYFGLAHMASLGAAGVARFGGFEFDLSSRELRKGRTRIGTPDQSLAILAMLLERPGELVTREAIQARLWPHGTVVEFEHSVNSAVNRLRQALLDTASTPRFVETLPRKGYRFIGTLEPLAREGWRSSAAGTVRRLAESVLRSYPRRRGSVHNFTASQPSPQ
jgi:DNA-binding winged helix-turn-helix (wHTH) protein